MNCNFEGQIACARFKDKLDKKLEILPTILQLESKLHLIYNL